MKSLCIYPFYWSLTISLFICGSVQTRSQSTTTPPVPSIVAGSEKPSGDSIPLPPEKAVPLRIGRFEKAPVIDGNLDDDVWQSAAVLKDFYQTNPGDNTAPSFPTEVKIGYDAHNLYLAIHAFDDPDKIRATVAKRDEFFGTDDSVRILLDTFNDRRRAYVLMFNPFGIQEDGIRTEGSGLDTSVDIVMESKGIIGKDGYSVEVAVPFKSLRYQAGKDKLWGVQCFRIIQRLNSEQDSWMPISRSNSSVLAQEGHISGLEGISTEHTLELNPSVTFSEDGRRVASIPPAILNTSPGLFDQGRFINEPIKPSFGLTAKYGVSPNISLDFALNPDFAQVEADQVVVTANQRFPIFYEEKRPFFLEGKEIFETPISAVHTRAIIAPEVAVKLTGKKDRNTFGILFASDKGPGKFSGDDRLAPQNFHFLNQNAKVGIIRLKHDIGQDSSIGVLATTYSFKPDNESLTAFDHTTSDPCLAQRSLERINRLGGVDGHFRVNKATIYDFQVLGTVSDRCFFDSNEGKLLYRTGKGLAYSSVYDVTHRNWGWRLENGGRTKDYRAEVGFTPRTNTNYDAFAFRYSTDPDANAKVISWKITSYNYINYDFQGRLQIWESDATAYWNLQHNTNFWLAYRRGHERLFEEEFGQVRTATRAGAFFGASERATGNQHFVAYFATQPDKKFGASLKAAYRIGIFDFDFGAGPRFPRVSPVALVDSNAPYDPGAGNLLDLSGDAFYQPTDAIRISVDYLKNRLVRNDTRRVAFDDNITSVLGTYQFTRFLAARVRIDYSTLDARARGQFLLAWTPSPGTALYAGYNDDVNRNGYNPFSGQFEPGIRRNGRTFFIKASYLFRKSF